MLIAFLTSDLVFPSRVAGIARTIDARLETAATADGLVAKVSSTASERVVVLIDLAHANIEIAGVVQKLKSLAAPPASIIAFGSHVHQVKLDAAKAAGCDLVLTRGQFDVQMAAILARFAESDQR